MKKIFLLMYNVIVLSISLSVHAAPPKGKYQSLANSMGKDYIKQCWTAGYIASKGEINGRTDLINWGEIMMQSYSRLSTYRWTEYEYMNIVIPQLEVMAVEFNHLDETRKSQIFFTCLKSKNKKLDELFSENSK